MTKLKSIASAIMISAAITACQAVQPIDIASFDEGVSTVSTWSWRTVTDELMEGKSEATFTNMSGIGIFDGNCALNPEYEVAGFCIVETTDGNHGLKPKGFSFVGANYLHLYVRSTIDYNGFQISLDTDTNKSQYPSFKANVKVPVIGEWTEVVIPFTDFSNSWDQFSGDIMIKCEDNTSVCITEEDKKHLSQIGIWAQGITGKFHLEVKAIRAGDKELAVPTTTAAPTTTTAKPVVTTTTAKPVTTTTTTTAKPVITTTTTAKPVTTTTVAPTTTTTTTTTEKPVTTTTTTTTVKPVTTTTVAPTTTTTVTEAVTTTEQPPAPKPSFVECSDPKTKKYFILDEKNGICEETCLISKLFWYFRTFVKPLQDSKGDNNICSTLNYGKYTKSISMDVPAAAVPLTLYLDVYEKKDMAVIE